MSTSIETLVSTCDRVGFDLTYAVARAWKQEGNNRQLAGYLPIYVPREILHALDTLPVGIMGTGDRMQIIKGDAFYQSYICHIPRGVVELALNGALNDFDIFLFPSICDVIRNLSGIFQLIRKDAFVKFLDYPQNFTSEIGGVFYRRELQSMIDAIEGRRQSAGMETSFTAARLNHAIKLYNRNRALIETIASIRQEYPWRLSAVEWYTVLRAGLAMPVEEHNEILEELTELLEEERGQQLDNIRVVVSGAFCEQPPIGLIRTVELAGCYIVDDDFMLGSRWIEGPIADDTDDPLGAIVDAYLKRSAFSSSVYDGDNPKGARLIELVRRRQADGVVFAAPSFCDPALLDRPELQLALERAGIREIGFQYSENTGQFKVIKEQVGAFSDSIKLWEVTESGEIVSSNGKSEIKNQVLPVLNV